MAQSRPSISTLGIRFPVSQPETVERSTLSASASSCWDIFFIMRIFLHNNYTRLNDKSQVIKNKILCGVPPHLLNLPKE